MEITYFGHSCFRLKGKLGTVVTDPYAKYTGLTLPNLSADIVTVSHQHPDHSAISQVAGTTRRPKPFIVSEPGEYEVGGVSVFGVPTYHDNQHGQERGGNTVFTVFIDELRVCHLGDLGHELSSDQLAEIDQVDVLLCPVGGQFTIDPEQAVKVINALEPSYVIPMHFKTDKHSDNFAELKTLADFLKVYGMSPTPVKKLSVEKSRLPEETELVVLEQ
jgi:L-ascorbate metabolism protein UlaG (beta-lactamase superfamily)